ncbi:hypothetical protein R3P38DRAFT_2772241 [Favolaschia claudopus]|uniref:Uncharacterized protein n=1 Tax=Favolaschia claudopus TaxID=2862362 RepID=A0AAW0C693_9AGAR
MATSFTSLFGVIAFVSVGLLNGRPDFAFQHASTSGNILKMQFFSLHSGCSWLTVKSVVVECCLIWQYINRFDKNDGSETRFWFSQVTPALQIMQNAYSMAENRPKTYIPSLLSITSNVQSIGTVAIDKLVQFSYLGECAKERSFLRNLIHGQCIAYSQRLALEPGIVQNSMEYDTRYSITPAVGARATWSHRSSWWTTRTLLRMSEKSGFACGGLGWVPSHYKVFWDYAVSQSTRWLLIHSNGLRYFKPL